MRPTLTQDASRLASAAASAQAAWDEAIQQGDEGAAVAAAIRLTACRVAARGGDESRAVEPQSFSLDANAAAAALHALRDAPFLVPDAATWLRLASAEDPRVSRALLALAPPVALPVRARSRTAAGHSRLDREPRSLPPFPYPTFKECLPQKTSRYSEYLVYF